MLANALHIWLRTCGMVIGFGLFAPVLAEAWTDSSGRFQVEAEYVGVEGTSVVPASALKGALRIARKTPIPPERRDAQTRVIRTFERHLSTLQAAKTRDDFDAALLAFVAYLGG